MTHPAPSTLAAFLDRIHREAGAEPVRKTQDGVEAVLRGGEDPCCLFLVNHGDRDAEAEVSVEVTDLLTGLPTRDGRVAAGDAVVVREPRSR